MNKKIIPVILCGGSGTRLWPLSRESYPKQFLSLNSKSNKSLLQQTILRISSLDFLPPTLISNEEHRFIVAEQMREIGIHPSSIILESEGKNTAPAIALAALNSLEIEEDPILIVLASDHLIKDNDAFIQSLTSAIDLANKNRIVTFGVIPKSAETGFGYIESKRKLDLETLEGCDIENFHEKPRKKLAEKFLADQRYSWNSGMFVFKSKIIISELEKFEPAILKTCQEAISTFRDDMDFRRLNEKVFKKCPSISIDKAVMEKTKIGSVVPLDASWSDVGNWRSLWEYEEKNTNNNLVQGKVFLKNVENSFFRSEGRLLVGVGLKDLIAIDTMDVTLIANKNLSQEIKEIVQDIKKLGMEESSFHKKGFRPWGHYLSIAQEENWQVKLIEVKPRGALSLQRHKLRAEHWIVVKGKALVRIEEKEKTLVENQSTFIPLGAKHQLSNPTDMPLSIIEVQSGSYLGEDDIERFEDNYGRAN